MPRDCTALPCYDRALVMNSPVSCLPDPIQNMPKKTQKKTQKKQTPRRVPQSLPFRPSMDNAGKGVAAAYGVVQGKEDMFPLVAGTGKSMVVQNYELVHTLAAGNGAFTIGGDVLNPGLATDYPWLSSLAKNYNKFRWRSLRYIYVPACSTASAGTEFLYFQYDYLDNTPTSITDVMASDRSVMGNVWFGNPINESTAFKKSLPLSENMNANLDISRLTRDWFYVRSSNNANQPVNTSLGGVIPAGLTVGTNNIYDDAARPAALYYGNYGTAGTATVGYLFAAYTVEFCEPILGTLNS